MSTDDETFDEPLTCRQLADVFRDAVLTDLQAPRRYRTPPWLRKWSGHEQDLTCVYCGAALFLGKPKPGCSIALADALVPYALGGPKRVADNAVLCCPTCKHRKGLSDWVAIGKAASPDLLDLLMKRRRAALLQSLNHVLPLTVRTESKAMVMFDKRWSEPRVKVYAGVYSYGGYFAWDPRTLPAVRNGDLKLQLRHGFGGRDLSMPGVALFEVPRDQWFAAAWDFIEQNSLLVEPTMNALERGTYRRHVETHEHEHEGRWFVVLPAQRWLQEVRRVARWATQAKPVRREVVRQQAIAQRKALMDEQAREEQSGWMGVML